MMKKLALFLLASTAGSLASAEPLKLSISDLQPIAGALAALDGPTAVIDQNQPDGTVKKVQVTSGSYDFGKDSVRIRLAIRKDLLAIKDAYSAFDAARVGYVKQIFGTDSLSPADFAKQPDDKKAAFNAKFSALQTNPVTLDMALFTEDDVATFAAAGVPGTTSTVLETLVQKTVKKKETIK